MKQQEIFGMICENCGKEFGSVGELVDHCLVCIKEDEYTYVNVLTAWSFSSGKVMRYRGMNMVSKKNVGRVRRFDRPGETIWEVGFVGDGAREAEALKEAMSRD